MLSRPDYRPSSVLNALGGVLLLLFVMAGPARAEVNVLTSIRPLALIAEAVVAEQGSVSHLLPASASPHDYPLKVSDMERLEEADLVVWVGADLESFLRRPLGNLSAERRMTLGELDSLHWPESKNEHDHHNGDSHHHDHSGRDPHLWLDPRNGAVIAQALAERLAERDPEHADAYRARAQALVESLSALDERLATRLKPLADRPFAVYHEGYTHFVARYQLNQVASVTLSPERRPGARHLYQLRQKLEGAVCLFTEPYYDMSAARALAQELDLRLGEVDLLGVNSAVKTYPALVERLGAAVAECLAQDDR